MKHLLSADEAEKYRGAIKVVRGYPIENFPFADISPLFLMPGFLADVTEHFRKAVARFQPATIIGIEARGFVFAAPLAAALNCRFVMARKKGKIPGDKVTACYQNEYAVGCLELPRDAVRLGDQCIIVDDFLATGSTAAACASLVEILGGTIVAGAFFIEETSLSGISRLPQVPIYCAMSYQ